mgnify:CR=1 FL=1
MEATRDLSSLLEAESWDACNNLPGDGVYRFGSHKISRMVAHQRRVDEELGAARPSTGHLHRLSHAAAEAVGAFLVAQHMLQFAVTGRPAAPMPGRVSAWGVYDDFRQMIDKEKLDAVFVGTTTHARVLCCIHAAQAGLGIYAEKPLTLTIAEGRTLVTAARRHRCIFQAGTQARSMRLDMWASEFLRSGGLGKIEKVVASNYMGPARRTPTATQPVPQEMNWDQWCKQAELVPHDPSLYHGCGKWGPWSAYDGGGSSWGVTGWGSHSYDAVQAALGTDDSGPVEVWAAAPSYPMSPVTMRYANGTILEMNLPRQRGPVWGAIFIGQKGKVEINRNRCVSNPPELVAGQPKVFYAQGGADTRPHIENWIECIKSRKPCNADIEIGQRATMFQGPVMIRSMTARYSLPFKGAGMV